MLKLIAASIARTIQKIKKKPRAVVVPIVGVAVLMAAAISSIGFRKENIDKVRSFAFSAVEATLKLSKAIGEFYDSNNKQDNLIRSKNNFLEITSQLKNLSDAKAGSQFILVPLESYPRFLFKRFNFSIILAGLLFEDYRTPPK